MSFYVFHLFFHVKSAATRLYYLITSPCMYQIPLQQVSTQKEHLVYT